MIQDHEVRWTAEEPFQVGFQVEGESFKTRWRGVDIEHAQIDVACRPRAPAGPAAKQVGCRKPFGTGACGEEVAQLCPDLFGRFHRLIIREGPRRAP